MNLFERYGETLRLISEGCDTITGVTESTGKIRSTVESHFSKLRRLGFITGRRSNPNAPALYSLTLCGQTWLDTSEMVAATAEIDQPASVVGQEDTGITAELYRWVRLSPPVPHRVVGRVHRLIDQE